ncbi:hypothetical protein [Alysiella crassa]|nr:hypothetical protein [Alysiella crassa]
MLLWSAAVFRLPVCMANIYAILRQPENHHVILIGKIYQSL